VSARSGGEQHEAEGRAETSGGRHGALLCRALLLPSYHTGASTVFECGRSPRGDAPR
jgi:hypothetical protein